MTGSNQVAVEVPPAARCLAVLKQQLGQALLQHIADDAAAPPELKAALRRQSAALDDIRQGVRLLLSYFEQQGNRPVLWRAKHAAAFSQPCLTSKAAQPGCHACAVMPR